MLCIRWGKKDHMDVVFHLPFTLLAFDAGFLPLFDLAFMLLAFDDGFLPLFDLAFTLLAFDDGFLPPVKQKCVRNSMF